METRQPKKYIHVYHDSVSHVYELAVRCYHRDGAPACETFFKDGGYAEEWWYEGKMHRFGGPSFTSKYRSYEYYIHGRYVTPEVSEWLDERSYTWETMTDIEKWELELFMRAL